MADAYLSTANSSPESPLHSKDRADVSSAHGIHGSVRVGLTGRDLKLPAATRIEQPDEFLADASLVLICLNARC